VSWCSVKDRIICESLGASWVWAGGTWVSSPAARLHGSAAGARGRRPPCALPCLASLGTHDSARGIAGLRKAVSSLAWQRSTAVVRRPGWTRPPANSGGTVCPAERRWRLPRATPYRGPRPSRSDLLHPSSARANRHRDSSMRDRSHPRWCLPPRCDLRCSPPQQPPPGFLKGDPHR
jgi:hypothetical protein